MIKDAQKLQTQVVSLQYLDSKNHQHMKVDLQQCSTAADDEIEYFGVCLKNQKTTLV